MQGEGNTDFDKLLAVSTTLHQGQWSYIINDHGGSEFGHGSFQNQNHLALNMF